MSRHAPEPWSVQTDGEGFYWIDKQDSDGGYSIANLSFGPDSEFNAHRIADCVNGCEGINPVSVPHLLALAHEIHNSFSSLDQDVRWSESPPKWWVVFSYLDRVAIAALAKAERGDK